MFCPYCKAHLVGDEIFCSNCGSKLPDMKMRNDDNKISSKQWSPSIKQQSFSHVSSKPGTNVGPNSTTPTTTPTQHPLTPYQMISRKEPWLAALLSFIFPGIGQIYAGKVARGISIMILLLGLPVFLFFAGISLVLTMEFSPTSLILFIMLAMMFYVIGFVLNIYDAYMVATRYNDFITRHGRPPTSMDNW